MACELKTRSEIDIQSLCFLMTMKAEREETMESLIHGSLAHAYNFIMKKEMRIVIVSALLPISPWR